MEILQVINLRLVLPHGLGFVLVFDFMVTDLGELIRDFANFPVDHGTLKFYLLSLLSGLRYMHDECGIMHRVIHREDMIFCCSL